MAPQSDQVEQVAKKLGQLQLPLAKRDSSGGASRNQIDHNEHCFA